MLAADVDNCSPGTGRSGLTLPELLLTLAVGSILLLVGVGGFRHLLLEARMTAAVNAMTRDLHLARQVANVRGHPVTLCPAATLSGCPGTGSWADGWSVVAPGPGGPLLLTTTPAPPGLVLHSNRVAYVFRPFSRRDTNGTIGFCDVRGAAAVRALVISPSGRPRLASGPEARARIKC